MILSSIEFVRVAAKPREIPLQLLFVGAVLVLVATAKRIRLASPLAVPARTVAVYAIGCLSAYWVLERAVTAWL